MDFEELLDQHEAAGKLPSKYRELTEQFYRSCLAAADSTHDDDTPKTKEMFELYLQLIEEQCADLYAFEPVHRAIRKPIDYYQFGIDVMEGIVDKRRSILRGKEQLDRIEELLAKGDNVVLLTNHQAESDPQLVSVILRQTHPKLAVDPFWVAGERVLIDPMAAPFSMGRNLLCVYSKKYIDTPPEKRREKQAHNSNTMRQMHKLFGEGGVTVFVAPSGGRDRPDEQGHVAPAPFDPSAVEMFRLMASHSPKPVHFFPLALATYNLLPPPSGLPSEEAAEPRYTKGGPVHLAFGTEIDMNGPPEAEGLGKRERRQVMADYAHKKVCELYSSLPQD